ncbi:MAG: hypothetical protein PHG45_04675 [Dehalococcoidales bacterium]|nr:hypothetical protein [Dehalococcoidales bacterium]
MTASQLKVLSKTMNFETAAYTVFNRIIQGEGPGLIVVWGGSSNNPVKANKSYFLNMIEAVQDGAKIVKPYVSAEVWALLNFPFNGKYQCIRAKEDSGLSHYDLYSTPISIVASLAFAGAIYRKGWPAEHKVVVLWDDIHDFVRNKSTENEQFLRNLANALDKQTLLTVIAASRFDWDAKAVLGSEHVVALGWD